MGEGVVVKIRTTKGTRRRVKEMAIAMHSAGLLSSDAMSEYVRQALLEKLAADRERLGQREIKREA